MTELKFRGFNATRTVRENRTSKCPLKSSKEMKKRLNRFCQWHCKWYSLCELGGQPIVSTFLTANPIKSFSLFSRAQRSQIYYTNTINKWGDSIFMMPLNHPIASIFALKNGGGHFSPIWSIQKLSMFGLFSPSYTNISSSFQISCCKITNDHKNFSNWWNSSSKKRSAFQWHMNIPTSRLDGKMHYIAKGDSRRRCKVFQSQAIYICSKCKQNLHEKCFKMKVTKCLCFKFLHR